MKLDLRRRNTGSPSTYIPMSTTPPSCRTCPFSSRRGRAATVVRRKPVAHTIVRISPLCRSICSRDDSGAGSVEALRRAESSSAASPASRAHSSKVSNRRSIFRSASANISGARRKQRPAVAHRARWPTSSTPTGEAIQIERRPFGRADELRRRETPRAGQVVDVVVALIPHPDRSIHQRRRARDTARQPDVLADRELTGRPERRISAAAARP